MRDRICAPILTVENVTRTKLGCQPIAGKGEYAASVSSVMTTRARLHSSVSTDSVAERYKKRRDSSARCNTVKSGTAQKLVWLNILVLGKSYLLSDWLCFSSCSMII